MKILSPKLRTHSTPRTLRVMVVRMTSDHQMFVQVVTIFNILILILGGASADASGDKSAGKGSVMSAILGFLGDVKTAPSSRLCETNGRIYLKWED